MEKVTIISLGWLGTALYNKLESEFDVLGTYFNSPKNGKNQIPFDINNNLVPKEILDSDVVIFCLPPSKIISDKHLYRFISPLKNKKIIFISSTSVYGMQGNVNENTIPNPETMNGKRLLEWENYIVANCPSYQIIRSAGQYGPARHPGRFLAGRENISGKNQSINLISQNDLLEIIEKSISSSDFQVINAVSTQHLNKENYYKDYCLRNNLIPPQFSEETSKLDKIVDTIYSEYLVTTSLD